MEINVWLVSILGYAYTYPEPKDKESFLTEMLYNHDYDSALPEHWKYPEGYGKPQSQ